ncbi:MAG: hypothetical protein WBO66_05340 [Candidatus Moraniibacteriota bacterium]
MEANSTTTNRDSVDSWVEKVISSCNHHDSDQAYSAWRKWDEMISLVSPEQKSEVMSLQEQLAYTAFPSFPQDVAASLIEKHLVSFLRSPVDIDEMIQNRFLYLGYGFEEDDRQALREATLKNTEQVGGRAVSEWLGALDGALVKSEDPESVMMQFFTQDSAVASMSRLDQAILRRLFQVYYDFLAFPVVTVYGLAETARKLSELEKSGVKEINVKEFFAPDRTAPQDFASDIPQGVSSNRQSSSTLSGNESLPLLKALGRFEKLGGQQVTNSKIVVKGQNDPVRPTIFNWLRAYRDELGVGAHDAVVRGQFLFHSLNGKGLSADERDQVGILLKSLDENMPLTIDAGRQEVLFQKQIPNIKYQIPNPPAVRQPADPIAEQPLPTQGTGNVSRAVFELPVMNHGMGNNPNSGLRQPTDPEAERPLPMQKNGTTAPANRPSAFEQAKAIQEANRDARLSISNMNAETVELGKMDASAKGGQASATGERSTSHPVAPASQSVAPAPRAISFEPAKIDNFSFGAGRGSDLQGIENSPPESLRESLRAGGLRQPADQKAERPLFANDANVSAVSFSTNHVLPAEKERIREQEIPNTIRQLTDQIPNAERPLPIPTAGASIKNETTAQPAPVKRAPAPPPVNRFRITPTGHRDTVASDDTPSPHVVDLRG